MKLVVPLKLSTVWFNVTIAPPPNAEPPNGQCLNVALLSRKVVFPVNLRLLLKAMIAPPRILLPHAGSVMFELCAPCQGNVSVIHYKCSAIVALEGTVN